MAAFFASVSRLFAAESPVSLFAEDGSSHRVDARFGCVFRPPRLVFDTELPVLFAGGAVLEAFYCDGKVIAEDVDVFVAVRRPMCTRYDDDLWEAALMRIVSWEPNEFRVARALELYSDADTAMTVLKLVEVPSGRKVDVVFVHMDPSRRGPCTNLDFHALLEQRFDIKICAMAWDGERLYYPNLLPSSILLKTTPVCGFRRIPPDRLAKYQARGFVLEEPKADRDKEWL